MESGKQQNYWPGFVDAMANMVMAMIFMVIVFLIMSMEALVHPSKPISLTTSDDNIKQSETPNFNSQVTAIEFQNYKNEIDELKNRINTLTEERDRIKSLLNTEVSVRADKNELQLSTEKIEKPAISISGSGRLIKIHYSLRVYQLDPIAAHKLNDILAKFDSAKSHLRINIISEIPKQANYSDGQRLAYYRAIEVRNFLLEQHWNRRNIDIRLINLSTPSNEAVLSLQLLDSDKSGVEVEK